MMDESSRKENTPTTNPESSAPSTPGGLSPKDGFFKRRTRRISSVLSRVNSEWNCFLVKIKSATHINYSDEEVLDSLFESSDSDFFERSARPKKCCNLSAAESHFIKEYKKHNSLDQFYEDSCSQRDMPSVESSGFKPYQALDVSGFRQKLPLHSGNVEQAPLTKNETLTKERLFSRDGNLGNALWEIRRARWLTSDVGEGQQVEEKVEQRVAQSSVKQISPELFPRIYRDFVEKAKPLKQGKRINLEDMVVVIHSGWVHDRVWENASKGLG